MARDYLATEGAALLDVFLVVGFLLNVWLGRAVGTHRAAGDRLRAHGASVVGVPGLLYLPALVCLLGLAITVLFHVETRGRSLEEIDPAEP
jgi:hypothetical protein